MTWNAECVKTQENDINFFLGKWCIRMKKQVDMINGNLLSGMFRFALPIVISSILQVFYNAADTFIVGAYDDPLSMGAVSSAGGVLGCVVNLFIGISIGVNILAARFFGAGDMETVKKFGGNAVILGAVSGTIICVLGQIFAEPLVKLIGIAPEIRERTLTYMRIYLCGVPFTALFNFISAFFRGAGETRRPTNCLIISGAVNVLFNVIFVKYMGMGVAGVALATSISMFVAFALIFRIFLCSEIGLSSRQIKFDKSICRNIILMGLPAGLQNLVNTVSNVFTTSAMNGFGAEAISGESIEIQLENILCVGIAGIVAAIVSFTGQNVGAGNHKRLNSILKTGFAVGTIYCIVGTIITYAIRVPFVEAFAHGNANVAMYAYKKINFIIVPFVTLAIQEVPSGMLRGIGQTFPAMLIAMGGCLFRICWILFLLPVPELHTVEFLFLSYPIVWTLCGVIAYVVYLSKKKKMFCYAED